MKFFDRRSDWLIERMPKKRGKHEKYYEVFTKNSLNFLLEF